MKQRKFSFFFAASLALAFVGCSHDELPGGSLGNEDNGSKDAVYMNVTVQLPVGPGTRSMTEADGGSNHGTEVGLDNENKVHSILLVLADKDNKFIGCGEKLESLSSNNGNVTTVQSISKSVLSEYYGGDNGVLAEEKQQIRVFVFCNPTSALRDIFSDLKAGDETWYEQVCTVEEDPITGSTNAAIWGGPDHQGGFLMSSSALAKKTLPKNFSDWSYFTTAGNPFKLTGKNSNIGGVTDNEVDNESTGVIKVERSVARFDFKDGSTLKGNTYNVVKDPEDDTKYIMQIQLQKMALFNMSKNFYYLRRVSDDGLNENSILCGTETSENYVVDTDATAKNDFNNSIVKANKYSDHFNFCLGHTPESGEWGIDGYARKQWYTSNISDVLNGTEDNRDGNETASGDYRIWRYVTENTIPGDPKMQVNGISTGIVFKGKMIATGDKESSLYKALEHPTGNPATDPILYVFGNEIFVRWTEVRAMAIERAAGSDLYKAVFGNTNVAPVAEKTEGDGTAVYSDDKESADYKWNDWYKENQSDDAKQKTFKDAAVGQGFTLYQSSKEENEEPGYYCYYFYLNRHNDNGNPGVMDKMEFAVVRNNVYKLAVTNISRLGHPRITDNDPDPIEPDNPDEDGDVYLSVDVQVLPWTVRVNNIEF